jgi:hypothetical protein
MKANKMLRLGYDKSDLGSTGNHWNDIIYLFLTFDTTLKILISNILNEVKKIRQGGPYRCQSSHCCTLFLSSID